MYILVILLFNKKILFRNVDELKKKLTTDEIIEKPKFEKQKGRSKLKVLKVKRKKVLEAPLHRLAKQRIESEIVYKDIKFVFFNFN